MAVGPLAQSKGWCSGVKASLPHSISKPVLSGQSGHRSGLTNVFGSNTPIKVQRFMIRAYHIIYLIGVCHASLTGMLIFDDYRTDDGRISAIMIRIAAGSVSGVFVALAWSQLS